jgi:hypothetical protein
VFGARRRIALLRLRQRWNCAYQRVNDKLSQAAGYCHLSQFFLIRRGSIFGRAFNERYPGNVSLGTVVVSRPRLRGRSVGNSGKLNAFDGDERYAAGKISQAGRG